MIVFKLLSLERTRIISKYHYLYVNIYLKRYFSLFNILKNINPNLYQITCFNFPYNIYISIFTLRR